jgi:hypothetical protein
MLEHLRGKAGGRKLRLFAVACCRRIWHLIPDARSRRAVEVAERLADGLADEDELRLAVIGASFVAERGVAASDSVAGESEASAAFAALNTTIRAEKAADYAAANAASAVYHAATAPGRIPAVARAAERAAQAGLLRDIFNPFRPVRIDPDWLVWNDGVVPRIARAVYDEKAFERLPVLADALEDAGYTDERLLSHCRAGGEHVRGCWAVDLVLGRE